MRSTDREDIQDRTMHRIGGVGWGWMSVWAVLFWVMWVFREVITPKAETCNSRSTFTNT